MNESKVFICVMNNDVLIEVIDYIIAPSLLKVIELYPQCDLVEEVPIELILHDIKELQK